MLLARNETLEKDISSDSGALSLIRRLLRRVYITETHDPEKRRDLNREYPDLTVPVAYTFLAIEDIKFVLDQVFRLDYAFTYSKRASSIEVLFQGLYFTHTHRRKG